MKSNVKLPTDIELGSAKIHTPEDDSSPAQVTFYMPQTVYCYGRRGLEDYKETIVEDLRIQSTTVFELMQHLAIQLRDEKADAMTSGEYLAVLATFGKSLQESIEIIENDFERYIKKHPEIEPAVLDLSIHPAEVQQLNVSAQSVSELLHRKDLPADVKEVLTSWCADNGGQHD